ncbi:MAG: acetylxylan esterase, partial [Leptospira sp.]|nr:acetylxylan esterase [Leptospira sp.]
MPVSFDECFQTFPKLSPPADFDEFWKDAIKELKNFPVKNQSKLHLKSSIIKETVYDISYQSAKNYQINGNLVIPRRRGNLPVVIHFHDYMGARPQIIKGLT